MTNKNILWLSWEVLRNSLQTYQLILGNITLIIVIRLTIKF